VNPAQQLLARRQGKSDAAWFPVGGFGRRAACAGFTLMEVTMVLLIMSILVGYMAFAFSSLDRNQSLNESAAELEKLAHQASRSSTVLDREFRIRFKPRQFYALEHSPDDFGVYREVDPQHFWALPPKVKLQIRRWGEKSWANPEGEGDDWIFSPSGISEPLSVRLTMENAFVELDFNPLTGTVEERRSFIP
jgi:prepilin-type N-terminal cleavage/methylation domain-containing protein